MKATFWSLCLSIIVTTALGQKPPVKFGEVPLEDVAMPFYEKDSSAAAVILADYGTSTIIYRQNMGFSLDFERVTRIKIFKKEGLEWGDFSIPLYKSGSADEKLTSLKAITYNLENGKIVESKLKNDGIFKESFDANRDYVKVTCPNVREGSVVEITYKVNSDSEFLFNFQDWSFQSAIPTILSEYRAAIPEYFNYDKYTQGYVPLTIADETQVPNSITLSSFERSGDRNIQSTHTSDKIDFMEARHRWVANHVPAFKPEPHMTSVSDYITKINFELSSIKMPNQPIRQIMGSWADINKTFSESDDCAGQISGNGFLRKITEEVTAGATTPEDKISAICNFVKQNVAWDGSQSLYARASLKKVLDDKKGNSAEINFLLGSMLDKADIPVLPVLLSTRNHGLLRIATPVASQFNYLICLAKVNDKSFLLDATERLLPTGILPQRCLNGQGFAVSKTGFQWIPLESKFKTRVVTSGDFRLTPGGELEGKLKLDCNGYIALQNRKKYLSDGESEYLKDFVGSHAWEIKSTEIQNAKEIQNNFIGVQDLVVNENMVTAGEMIYLDPFIHSSQKDNPFKSEVREYPVDFGSPLEETFFFKLTLPDGYVVDELPESKIISMPENGARYIYNVVQNGNLITVTSMFHINKSMFTQLEYPYLREFYNQIVAKQAELIVLKKK
ncbi:MAG: transglutaminase domain-containing protein [Cyclobacteriaceae bacterium]